MAAAITGLVVAIVAGLARGNSSLGALTPVVVATQPIEAGRPLSEQNTEIRRYPALSLPAGALAELTGDEMTSAPLYPGDVVTGPRLGGLPLTGRIEVAVPGHTALPPLAPGDRVDVLVTLPIPDESGSKRQATLTVARAAVITNTADHAVTIAVTNQELIPVAAAVVEGSITLALIPP
ncbi:SAF domain-containing protein [Candidatus Poriferisocius sp.]|uniref:SAF domain-containing protein n=1 Tax=Candidatus Poriferisocius sp. TaxID=3101276 RepID=UPI003B01791C